MRIENMKSILLILLLPYLVMAESQPLDDQEILNIESIYKTNQVDKIKIDIYIKLNFKFNRNNINFIDVYHHLINLSSKNIYIKSWL